MFNVLRRLGVIVLVVCAVARPAGAEDAVKIAVLGDSLSAGFGLMAHQRRTGWRLGLKGSTAT